MHRIVYQLDLNQTNSWCMEKLHFHESVEILLCLSEGGLFFINNRSYNIKNGSLFILKSAILHRSLSNRNYQRYVLHISEEELKNLSSRQSDFIAQIENAPVHTLLNEINRTILIKKFKHLGQKQESAFGGDILKNLQLIDLLIFVIRFSSQGSGQEGTIINSGFDRVEKVIRFIQQNYDQPLTLDILAQHFFISKYHLCHIFKSATGLGVTEYLIKCRITKARDLLRRGYRVHEVGEMVGFRNNSHFIRTFRKMTGISPKAYADQYEKATVKESEEIFLG